MSTQRPIMNIIFRTSHDAETKCNVTRLKSLTDSYLRSSYFANPYNGSYSLPNYIPIPELSRLEADIYILFLSPNHIIFPQPTADLWYNSSQSGSLWTDVGYSDMPNNTFREHLSTEAASPLGCTHQDQYCFPELPACQNCTSPAGNIASVLARRRHR